MVSKSSHVGLHVQLSEEEVHSFHHILKGIILSQRLRTTTLQTMPKSDIC